MARFVRALVLFMSLCGAAMAQTHTVGPMEKQKNLSDLDNPAQALANLGALNKSGDTMTGPLALTVAPNVSAAGAACVGATPITAQTTILTTVGAGAGVALNPAIGVRQTILDRGLNVASVCPPSGAQIGVNAIGAPVGIGVGGGATFECISPTLCVVE